MSAVGSFADLNGLIDGNNNGTIILDDDYVMQDSEGSIYKNGITINKIITIGAEGHTINASNIGRIFNVTKDGNLTLINASLINGNSTNGGGAIHSSGICTVINSTFTNNTANEEAMSGGAIGSNGTNFNVISSYFVNNSGVRGGAIWSDVANFTVINSTFMKNKAASRGGAIWNCGTGFTVSGSTFMNNIAREHSSGGCAVWDESRDINVVNSFCDVKSLLF